MSSEDPSGRILVRLPHTLHGELARQAKLEGVSLNQFIVGALAGAVGWRADGRPRTNKRNVAAAKAAIKANRREA